MIERGEAKCLDSKANGAARCLEFKPNIGPTTTDAGIQDIGVDGSHLGGCSMRQDAAFNSPIDQQDPRVSRVESAAPLSANLAVELTPITAHLVEMQLQNTGRISLVERNDVRVGGNAAFGTHAIEERAQLGFKSGGR